MKNHNRSQTNMLKSYTRIMTQRMFNRVSEDTINGNKAMTVRRQLRDLDIYQDNLSSAKALFSSAEVNLDKVAHDLYISIEEQLVAACTGTDSQDEMDIYATSLRQTAEEMVDTLNGDYGERRIFGGTNNGDKAFDINCTVVQDETGKVVYPPYFDKYYEIDAATGNVQIKEGVKFADIPKNVTYNDVPVDMNALGNMIFGDGTIGQLENGNYKVTVIKDVDKTVVNSFDLNFDEARAKNDNSLIFPGSKPIYVDIGIGIKYDNNYEVDPQTALDTSLNGAAITGSGMYFSDDWTKNCTYIDDNGNTAVKHIIRYMTKEQAAELGIDVDNYTPPSYFEGPATKEGVIGHKGQDGNIDEEVTLYAVDTGELDLSGVYSNNMMQLTLDAAKSLEDGGYSSTVSNFEYDTTVETKNGDQAYVNGVIDRAAMAEKGILTALTTLGAKQNDIEFYQSRTEDYEFNLKERQNLVEGTDMEAEIMNYYNIEAAYQAFLKIGTQVIPGSIFDYV
ncbi:MAG: hypothetical protein J1E40_07435 [Oscillospiraceae bacterium]|nr:hypothetical protein [Oscillospiraceae bacterium]